MADTSSVFFLTLGVGKGFKIIWWFSGRKNGKSKEIIYIDTHLSRINDVNDGGYEGEK